MNLNNILPRLSDGQFPTPPLQSLLYMNNMKNNMNSI